MNSRKYLSEFNSSEKLREVTIGVLAVQGSFYEHIVALNRLSDDITINVSTAESSEDKIKLKVIDIRSSKDVKSEMRGLIIPGKIIFLLHAIDGTIN